MKEDALMWQINKFLGINQPHIEDRVRDFFDGFTYKPGFIIEVNTEYDARQPDSFRFAFKRQVPDVDSPSKQIEIRCDHYMTYGYFAGADLRQLAKEILNKIIQFEEHEAIEWFKFRGARVEDPHPELKERR